MQITELPEGFWNLQRLTQVVGCLDVVSQNSLFDAIILHPPPPFCLKPNPFLILGGTPSALLLTRAVGAGAQQVEQPPRGTGAPAPTGGPADRWEQRGRPQGS